MVDVFSERTRGNGKDERDGRIRPAGGRRDRREFFRWALWYTLLFAVVGAAVFFPFARAGRSFAWVADGLSQHFVKLLFLKQQAGEGLRALFSGQGWTFPMYDFHTGLVALDTQYGFLELLALLWPADRMNGFYTFYTLFSYYLTGLSFVYFGWWFRQRRAYALAGALSYIFCGFALFAGVRHPHFLAPMILLPLLIVGVEKVMDRERSWLLTAAVFLSATAHSGVYFSCMQAVFLGLYVCVRFFDRYHARRLREFVLLWVRLAIWGGTGALLSGFTAIPTLREIFSGERVGVDIWSYTDPWLYSGSYDLKFLTYFSVLPNAVGKWMRLGFSALCLPAVLVLFVRREKKTRTLRVLFLLLTVMHLIPAVGYALSGFSSVTNRFCFGYAFCVSAILMFTLPALEELSRRQWVILGCAAAVYVGACAFLRGSSDPQTVWVASGVLTLTLALVCLCRFGFRHRCRRFLPALCLGITCLSVAASAFLLYDERAGDYVSQFSPDPQGALASGQYASLGSSETVAADGTFFRVMGDNAYGADQNCAFLYGLNGLTAYPYYGQSGAYMSWLREMQAPRVNVMLNPLVRQSHMLTLAGVKYYASRNSDEADWPYGFRPVDRVTNGGNTDVILENENWLPLGYTYDRYITRAQYKELDPLGKRRAQMQAAVLSGEPENVDLPQAEDVTSDAWQIPCQVEPSEGIAWAKGKLKVSRENATLTLRFDGMPETETYVRVVGLDLTKKASTRSWDLAASTEQTWVSGTWNADAYVYANHQHTQLLDLGYSKDGMTSVTLTFPKKGTFKLKDLQVWCQDMTELAAQAAALRAEPLEDIETGWRGLTGTISLSKDKLLCVALPWMAGWRAYVDGEEVPLYRVNTGFMGLGVPAGEHTVQLRYRLPGLRAGLLLTGMGAMCAAGLAICCRRRKNCANISL